MGIYKNKALFCQYWQNCFGYANLSLESDQEIVESKQPADLSVRNSFENQFACQCFAFGFKWPAPAVICSVQA
jgi:hypothetical protein